MNWKYFFNAKTIEELKTAYRKLVMIHHPDRGGSEAAMKEINNEYADIFPFLKGKTKAATATETTEEKYEREKANYHDVNDGFREVIEKIISVFRFTDIFVEICGCWIWVSGKTIEVKDIMKEAGFKWSRNKKAWYWHTPGYSRRTKKHFTLEEIREMHGSIKIEGEAPEGEDKKSERRKTTGGEKRKNGYSRQRYEVIAA
jgi:DnaJ-class molecular chaperone